MSNNNILYSLLFDGYTNETISLILNNNLSYLIDSSIHSIINNLSILSSNLIYIENFLHPNLIHYVKNNSIQSFSSINSLLDSEFYQNNNECYLLLSDLLIQEYYNQNSSFSSILKNIDSLSSKNIKLLIDCSYTFGWSSISPLAHFLYINSYILASFPHNNDAKWVIFSTLSPLSNTESQNYLVESIQKHLSFPDINKFKNIYSISNSEDSSYNNELLFNLPPLYSMKYLLNRIQKKIQHVCPYIYSEELSITTFSLKFDSEIEKKSELYIEISEALENISTITFHSSIISSNQLLFSISPLISFSDINIIVSLLAQIFKPIINNLKDDIEKDNRNYNILITGGNGWLSQHVYLNFLQSFSHSTNVNLYLSYSTRIPSWILPSNAVFLPLDKNINNLEENSYEQEQTHDQFLLNQLKEKFNNSNNQLDVVVHLAANSSPVSCHQNPIDSIYLNESSAFINSLNLLNPSCFLLFASTDMVYDGWAEFSTEGLSEEDIDKLNRSFYNMYHTCLPVNYYGLSKLKGEDQAKKLEKSLCLRLSNMIGSSGPFSPFIIKYTQDKNFAPSKNVKFLEFLLSSILNKQEISVRTYEKRSFLHLHDVVNIIGLFCYHHLLTLSPTISYYLSHYYGYNSSLFANSERFSSHLFQFSKELNEKFNTIIEKKILNTGGPMGISRYELSKKLSKSLNIKLIEDEEIEEPNDNTSFTWKIKKENISTDDIESMKLSHSENPFSRLISPLNISMDVKDLEEIFPLTSLDNELLLSLSIP